MSLRDLELTPALEKLLVEAGLGTVELVLEHEDRLAGLPGMTPKRLEAVTDGIKLHRLTLRDLERRRFIADRAAQADRIDTVMAFLDGLLSGSLPCSLDEARAVCDEARRYARTMADERNASNVAMWIQHKEAK